MSHAKSSDPCANYSGDEKSVAQQIVMKCMAKSPGAFQKCLSLPTDAQIGICTMNLCQDPCLNCLGANNGDLAKCHFSGGSSSSKKTRDIILIVLGVLIAAMIAFILYNKFAKKK